MHQLRKALNRLRQAPCAWNIKLYARLISLGFVKCASEHALYMRHVGHCLLVVGVYGYNLIIIGSSHGDIDKFKREMTLMFHMSDLGLLIHYLSIEVS